MPTAPPKDFDTTSFTGAFKINGTYEKPFVWNGAYVWRSPTLGFRTSLALPAADSDGSLWADPTAAATAQAARDEAVLARDSALGYANAVALANASVIDLQEAAGWGRRLNSMLGYRVGAPAIAPVFTRATGSWVTITDSPYLDTQISKALRIHYATTVSTLYQAQLEPTPPAGGIAGLKSAHGVSIRKSHLLALPGTGTQQIGFSLYYLNSGGTGAFGGTTEASTGVFTLAQATTANTSTSINRTVNGATVSTKLTVTEVTDDWCHYSMAFGAVPAGAARVWLILKLLNVTAAGDLEILAPVTVWGGTQVSPRAIYPENAIELDHVAALYDLYDKLSSTVPVSAVKDTDGTVYLRSRMPGTDYDFCVRVVPDDLARNRNAQVHSRSLIPKLTAPSGIATAHIAGMVQGTQAITPSSCDDSPPVRVNDATVGGNHMHEKFSRTGFTAAHLRTAADIGQRLVDTAGVGWTLMQIPDATHLDLAQDYTLDGSGVWSISGALPTGTLTVTGSGSVHTSALTVAVAAGNPAPIGAYQLGPATHTRTVKMMIDGKTDMSAQTAGTVVAGQFFELMNEYTIADWRKVIDSARAHVGNSATFIYNDPDWSAGTVPAAVIDGIFTRRELTHFSRSWREEVHILDTLLKAARLRESMVAQAVPLIVTGSRKRKAWIPNTLPYPVTGADYEVGVDVTAATPQASISQTPATWRYAWRPPSRMIQEVFESDGVTPVLGMAIWIDETVGAGHPTARLANLGAGWALEERTTGKVYIFGFGDSTNAIIFPAGWRARFRVVRVFYQPGAYGAASFFL